MPLVKTRAMRFRPRSLSDTLDGANSPEGACAALVNLIQDPSTPNCLQCRPAAVEKYLFADFSSPGVISGAFQTNNLLYGLVATARNSGQDEPFVYDLIAQAIRAVSGVTAANTPTTQGLTGDWNPPTAAAVGTRVIMTHPGFSGGVMFGYFDVSGYSATGPGNIASGSKQVTGNTPISGVGPGYTISGTGIPASTTVLNAILVTPQSTGTTTSGSATIASVASTTGFAVGQPIEGVGIPLEATIASIGAGSIVMSVAATASGTVTISATGSVITMSANASATTSNLSITIAGGTAAAPLWAAGNTTNVPLAGVPQAVAQFNNRAWFAQGQYLAFTDPLSLNISQATNILTIGDVSPITALCPLTIINASGAPVQGLLAFKKNLIVLVTGDPTTNDLAVTILSPAAIGTSSPRAICPTEAGVYFIDDATGLRCIQLNGQITDPLPDVRVPFIFALNRSRISGAYSSGIYRVCLQSGAVAGTPFQEFWFDLKYRLWTGPHTFRQSLIVAWAGTFLAFSDGTPATLYQSDPTQNLSSVFTENGVALQWQYKTCSLPEDDTSLENSCVVSTLNLAFKSGASQIVCQALDENFSIINSAIIYPPGGASLWGNFIWGVGIWLGNQFGLRPYQIPWTDALVFSKLSLNVTGASSLGFKISNFQAEYQPLGYVTNPLVQ